MGASMPTRQSPWEKFDKEVCKRYRIDKRIGRGCYGVVFSAEHLVGPSSKEHKTFAVKKILHAFKNSDEAQRTYREVNYLMEFNNHDNILKIHEVLVSADDKHLYIVTDLMDSDLQKALRVKALQKVHRVYVVYQVLRALKFLHSAGVMHRDVKPANVLLNKTCEARLADFGWAREAPSKGDEFVMTDYASSRWYRCPEVLLGAQMYHTAVDMWAIGCIAGEMFTGGQALLPGTSTIDMLDKIVDLTGKPSPGDIVSMEAPRAALTLEPIPPGPPHRSIEQLFPAESPEFHDFLQLLIQWNPEKRLTATEALSHPFVGCFHNPDDEPVFGRKVCLEVEDHIKLTPNRYRDYIYADHCGMEDARIRVELAKRKDLQMEADVV